MAPLTPQPLAPEYRGEGEKKTPRLPYRLAHGVCASYEPEIRCLIVALVIGLTTLAPTQVPA